METEADSMAAPSRNERRRERTRAALIDAAIDLVAAQGQDLAIQAITDRADVGLGSFYNHFRDKQDIFRAASADALAVVQRDTVMRTASIPDPLERVAAAFRLICRISTLHPRWAPMIILEGELTLETRQAHVGLLDALLARLDATDVFHGDDMPLRTSFVIASLRLVMRLRLTDPGFDDAEADKSVELMLQMLGVDAETARTVCRRPLPEAPTA